MDIFLLDYQISFFPAIVTKTNTTTITIQPSMSVMHDGWDPQLKVDTPRDNFVGKQYKHDKPVHWTTELRKGSVNAFPFICIFLMPYIQRIVVLF